MNVYDLFLSVKPNISEVERIKAQAFINRNDYDLSYIEGVASLRYYLGQIRKAQDSGVGISVDAIFKRCPYATYENVTKRYVENGNVKKV